MNQSMAVQSSPSSSSSSSENQNYRNRGSLEVKMKLKKMRSIKLSRVPSLKPSIRRSKPQFNWVTVESLMEDDSSFNGLDPIRLSDPLPNYMKSTTCSIAKKEISQAGIDSKDISVGSSTVSTPCSKNQDEEIKQQPMKNSKSKLSRREKSRFNRSSIDFNVIHQHLDESDSKFSQSGKKSNLRTVRFLKKKTSFKLPVDKSTCSSTLKNLKLPESAEKHESERISAMKVCPYHHCSLNGHSHSHSHVVLPKRKRSRKFQNRLKGGEIRHVESDLDPAVQGGENSRTIEETHLEKVENFQEEEREGNDELKQETSSERFCIETHLSKSVSKGFDGDFKVELADSRTEQGTNEPGAVNEGTDLDIIRTFHAEEQETNDELKEETISERFCIKTDLDKSVSSEGFTGDSKVENGDSADSRTEQGNEATNPNQIRFFHAEEQETNDEPKQQTIRIETNLDKSGSSVGSNSDSKVENGDLADSRTDHGIKGKQQISLWQLIHRHMASSAEQENTETKMPPSPITEEEIELKKLYAIKLVREAIEKILLPEVQEQESDNQSVCSDVSTEKEHIEESQGEDSSQNSNGECVIDKQIEDPKEETETKTGNKPEKQALKNWSNLKKLILLRRFVKELEKVKKFNPKRSKKTQKSTSETAQEEAESVRLKHQTTAEKKASEEWMLDYALQQAVHQLAPTQRRKVSLLVKAFETVVVEDRNHEVNSSKVKDSVENERFEVEKVAIRGLNSTIMGSKSDHEVLENQNEENLSKTRDQNREDLSEIREDKNQGSKSDEMERFEEKRVSIQGLNSTIMGPKCDHKELEKPNEANFSKTNDHSREDLKEIGEDVNSGLNSDSKCDDMELSKVKKAVIRGLNSTIMSSKSDDIRLVKQNKANSSKVQDQNQEDLAEINEDPKLGLSSNSKCEEKEPSKLKKAAIRGLNSTIMGSKSLEKQSHIGMWHMIYQHVVTGIAEKVGDKLLDGEDEDEKNEGENAVKLVQEAVDEILLPDIQDDFSDAQSTASEILQDEELLENNHGNGGEQEEEEKPISNSTDNLKNSDKNYESLPDQVKTEPQRVDKQRSKNWSKLKKLILLKRSIKALEKARKLKPKATGDLPLLNATVREKVDLRNQMMDERKKAEQWMLDYAVQHIVTKLTPARKRRVAMLVEAFEAVVPLPEI